MFLVPAFSPLALLAWRSFIAASATNLRTLWHLARSYIARSRSHGAICTLYSGFFLDDFLLPESP